MRKLRLLRSSSHVTLMVCAIFFNVLIVPIIPMSVDLAFFIQSRKKPTFCLHKKTNPHNML